MTERRNQLLGFERPPSDWLIFVGAPSVIRGTSPVASKSALAKECISTEMS